MIRYLCETRPQTALLSFGSRLFTPFFTGLLVLFLSGCAIHEKSGEPTGSTYVTLENTASNLSTAFAPVFIIPEWQKPYNRIGKVVAEKHGEHEKIRIDPNQPTIYTDQFTFSTRRATYINLVYRIHFQNTPFSLIPFHFAAGKNMGLLVVITLSEDHIPLLVTTVQTCGCYAVVIPTSMLPADAYPEDWIDKVQHIFGEVLPSKLLEYTKDEALLVTVRPEVHRIMDLRIDERKELLKKDILPANDMTLQSLKTLPLANGETTSFYYNTWPLRGHVKGSIKLWESFLLSFVSFDLYVGMDKEFGDTAVSGNSFYTSLKVWNRKTSDMNNFAQFLNFLGWRL